MSHPKWGAKSNTNLCFPIFFILMPAKEYDFVFKDFLLLNKLKK